MALITCPKCGGSISDTAVKCVHCGADLSAIKKQEQTEREYSTLPVEEKTKIRKEYDKIHPEYALQEKRQKNSTIGLLIVGVVFVLALALYLIFYVLRNFDVCDLPFNLIYIPLGFAVLSFVVGAIFYFLIKNGRRRELFEQKKFVSWLKKEKNLTYNIILSEKDRAVYNSYKVN